MFPMRKAWLLIGVCLALAACRQPAPVQEPQIVVDAPANGGEGGALSGGQPAPATPKPDLLKGTEWPAAELVSGEAIVSCDRRAVPPAVAAAEAVPEVAPDGGQAAAEIVAEAEAEAEVGVEASVASDEPPLERGLVDLSFASVEQALAPCESGSAVWLHYRGKIATDFTALVERVSNMAERKRIERRVLDLDSPGGHVEDAMKAGDIIGASRWTIRVAEDANCHSACVLILAAGDHREIGGRVGVHRMIRVNSMATTREELTQELREVYGHMKDYLERNGAAVTVADLMMTVPNRKLRLLTPMELVEHGLEGPNAVQDDLERIQLTRKCGDDFVRRKDNYDRAFTRQCAGLEPDLEAADACGLELRRGFGFPDEKCPVESPLSRLDREPAGAGDQAGRQ
jgi:hypothetical protein